eukprot:1360624-Rhodomonas_salina.1
MGIGERCVTPSYKTSAWMNTASFTQRARGRGMPRQKRRSCSIMLDHAQCPSTLDDARGRARQCSTMLDDARHA